MTIEDPTIDQLRAFEEVATKMADSMQQKVWAAEYDPGSDAGDAASYVYAATRPAGCARDHTNLRGS